MWVLRKVPILGIFLSTLSLRRATITQKRKINPASYFYPRSPCGERPGQNLINGIGLIISIHALLAESDTTWQKVNLNPKIFLSTLSLRRATLTDDVSTGGKIISIHALLAESDNRAELNIRQIQNFYPRSPCGERRPSLSGTARHTYFYPRSPCGERPVNGDVLSSCFGNFYPRSPCGERRPSLSGTARHTYFYPRSPCGERLNGIGLIVHVGGFLSTLSLRRATRAFPNSQAKLQFLSTLSLRRATVNNCQQD